MKKHYSNISYERPEIRVSEIEAQGVFLALSFKIEVDPEDPVDGGWIDFDE